MPILLTTLSRQPEPW